MSAFTVIPRIYLICQNQIQLCEMITEVVLPGIDYTLNYLLNSNEQPES